VSLTHSGDPTENGEKVSSIGQSNKNIVIVVYKVIKQQTLSGNHANLI